MKNRNVIRKHHQNLSTFFLTTASSTFLLSAASATVSTLFAFLVLDLLSIKQCKLTKKQMMKRCYNLAITLSLLIIPHLVNSQRPDYTLTPQQENRIFFWSSKAPLSKAINELAPEVIPSVDLLLHHASRVENSLITSLVKSRAPKPDDPVKPCNPQIPNNWRSSVSRSFGVRGLIQPVFNCGADINGVSLKLNDEAGYTIDDLYNAAFNHRLFIHNRVKLIASRVITNFTTPGLAFNFTYVTTSVSCSHTPVCLAKQGEHWYAKMIIHNAAKDTHAKDGFQISVGEYARVLNGRLGDSPKLWLPVFDNGGIERVIRQDGTTYLQRWSTNPNPSCFREIQLDENPAVLDAIDQAHHFAQQVEDALTSSNLAILVLPLGLTLIPISLVSDVSTTSLLLYGLMSDVLTVIPLAIKGVELMITGNKRWRSVVTRMTSSELGNGAKPISAGAEIWAAECKVRGEVQRTGAILVVVALVFLFFGIGGELLAKRWVNRLKRRALGKRNSVRMAQDISKHAEHSSDSSLCGARDKDLMDYIGTSIEDLERYSISDVK